VLDSDDPLVALADTINWAQFDDSFEKYYSDNGRPAKPIRLMVGLLILKQLENLSDENAVLQWKPLSSSLLKYFLIIKLNYILSKLYSLVDCGY